jgi:hypothetical protein
VLFYYFIASAYGSSIIFVLPGLLLSIHNICHPQQLMTHYLASYCLPLVLMLLLFVVPAPSSLSCDVLIMGIAPAACAHV